MTEQVIDIRDRIEKMRNQMTVPGSKGSVEDKKKPANDINDNQVPNIKTKTEYNAFKTENIEAKISTKSDVQKPMKISQNQLKIKFMLQLLTLIKMINKKMITSMNPAISKEINKNPKKVLKNMMTIRMKEW